MKTRSAGLFLFVAALAFFLVSCEKGPVSRIHPNNVDLSGYVSVQALCGQTVTSKLFAGKTTEVGTVTVEYLDPVMKITYKLLPGYFITETRLSVTNSLEAVPQTSGRNPQIGLFEYSTIHNPPVNIYVYENVEAGSYILAHAVVRKLINYQVNMPALDISLPAEAKIKVTYAVPGSRSYFTTTVYDGGILNGVYEGWCVDVDNVIYSNMEYPVKVYSSYNPSIADLGLVEFPQNLDKVNWIINHDFTGQPSLSGGEYTYGDVQMAIWQLIEDSFSASGLGVWSQTRVDEIKAAADMPDAGEGFIPGCGQMVAVFLRPYDANGPLGVQLTVAQITLINFELVCIPVFCTPETAWAAGKDFGGNSWAKYFYFCY